MRREGSPWEGFGTVYVKELTDHISSVRMLVLGILIFVISCVVVYVAIDNIRQTTAEDPFVLLKLFTSGSSVLSLVFILGITLPVVAIALGFDAINGEHNRRTMSRILSQPIYRDALLAGKFLAALTTLGINLLCLWLLVVGLGILFLGVPPSGEEIARSLSFMLITLAYGGTWLAFAMLLSIVSRSAATAVLVGLGIWLFLTFLWPFLANGFAAVIAPPDPRYEALAMQLGLPTPGTPETWEWTQILSRVSPNYLYTGAATGLLAPDTPALGMHFIAQLNRLQGGALPAPLSLASSLAVASPPAVALIAGVIVLFVAGYVVFQRQEVRE